MGFSSGHWNCLTEEEEDGPAVLTWPQRAQTPKTLQIMDGT